MPKAAMVAPKRPEAPAEARRRRLIDAALGVFARYGYRKTSMEEVARAAQISRQALYLHFATKEDLFRAAVTAALASGLEAATAVLRQRTVPLQPRLVRAFDEWVGPYVGAGEDLAGSKVGAHAALGPLAAEHERRFAEAVAQAIGASALAAGYRSAGLSARQLAETLLATARGLKHGVATREAFGRGMAVAVRVLCMPLGHEPVNR